ncbi:MAG: hypothetical protein GWO85_01230 [Simkaniaceae bacterium]|nr:hypothetical protein [Simkaniaceae bacterium]
MMNYSVSFLKKAHLLGFFLWMLILLTGCGPRKEVLHITGNTMGTTYSITIVDFGIGAKAETLKAGIDSVLVEINRQMSTYDPTSEISRLNRSQSADWFPVSPDFFQVLLQAQQLSQESGGLFDITVLPLINLWGFHYYEKDPDWQPPQQSEIDSVMRQIGFQNIIISENRIRKQKPDLQLDVNAIAKGYGVDAVVNFLQARAFKDYLVEIGGEIRCLGMNQHNSPWAIGIDQPVLNSMAGTSFHNVVSITDVGMATSGDYRNYVIYNDRFYSHVINPLTGYPTQSKVSSATVIAPTCMLADGLATTLLVMEREEGIRFINSMDNVEALIIVRNPDGTFSDKKSKGFDDYIKD